MLPARKRGFSAYTATLHPILPPPFTQPDRPNAATGQCRKWNADIPALNGSGNFATVWQVSAAFFFIVFILAFVAFVMSLLERFVHLPSFVKGRVGLVYHSFILVAALIAVIIGGVKFQEIHQFTGSVTGAVQNTYIFLPLQNGLQCTPPAGGRTACLAGTDIATCRADCTRVLGTAYTNALSVQSCLYWVEPKDPMSFVNLCSHTSTGVNPDKQVMNVFATANSALTPPVADAAAPTTLATYLSYSKTTPAFWGFGLGVAVTSVVMAAFQLFVAFRHFAAESRAADTKGDGNAA
jgi:hypothetical protein